MGSAVLAAVAGPAGAPALWLYRSDTAGVGTHAAFRAPLDRFHSQGLPAAGRDNGTPGLRADYGPTYYAAFLID